MLIDVTLTAVFADAIMLSIEDRSGNTPIFSTRFAFIFMLPVRGLSLAWILRGFNSYETVPSGSILWSKISSTYSADT